MRPCVRPASVPTPDFHWDTSLQLSGPEPSVCLTPPVFPDGLHLGCANQGPQPSGHRDWVREGGKLWRWLPGLGTLTPLLTQRAIRGKHRTCHVLCFFICTKETVIVLSDRVVVWMESCTKTVHNKY